jgi:MoxR-like ATPase
VSGGPAGVGKTELAKARPLIVLTSNATRELSEALRRRCLERRSLDQATVDDALHLLLEHQRDLQRARAELRR